MQGFVDGIMNFIRSIRVAIVQNVELATGTDELINSFFQSRIIDGTMISSPLTWSQLISYVLPIILIGLCIYLFIKFIVKILGIFRFN